MKQWIDSQKLITQGNSFLNPHQETLQNFKVPLKGIRILCKGPNYKARRKRKFLFQFWLWYCYRFH